MNAEEYKVLASELATEAANNIKFHTPDNIEDIDLPSFQSGMRFALAAFTETLRVTAKACQKIGREDAATVLTTLAADMAGFPIVGE